MRAIIVGGGIFGLCTAWALRRRGHQVTLYEAGPIPNPRASSWDEHRLIRYVYGNAEGYARMVTAGYAGWEALWADLGTRHYAESGTLLLAGRRADQRLDPSLPVLERIGLPLEVLDGPALRARFAPLDLGAYARGLYLPSGGILFARSIEEDLAAQLAAGGAVLHDQAPVAAVDAAAGRVTLADGRSDEAELVLVAAGPWIGRLVPALAPRVYVSRQAVVLLDPPADARAAWEKLPMVLRLTEDEDEDSFWFVPPRAGRPAKLGVHVESPGGDPDGDRSATTDELERLMRRVRARLTGWERFGFHSVRTCFYTYAHEDRFIAHREGRMLALSCCSGHGFKFAAAIGLETVRMLEGAVAFDSYADWLAGRAMAPPA